MPPPAIHPRSHAAPALRVDVRGISAVLFKACALVVLLGIASHLVQGWAPQDWGKLRHLAGLFDLNEERTVPTAFAVAQLLLAAGLLGALAAQRWRVRDPWRRHWVALALLVLLMALDEQAGLHERLSRPAKTLLGRGEGEFGALYYAWVLPAALLVTVVAAAFLRFVWHLPADTRRGFIMAAVIFVGGALGLELLGGYFAEQGGVRDPGLLVASTGEEAMELFGIAMLIRTTARHASRYAGGLVLRLESQGDLGAPRAVSRTMPSVAPAASMDPGSTALARGSRAVRGAVDR
jgi:hypothetical protein